MIEIEYHVSEQTVEIEKSRAENLDTEDILYWCFKAKIEFIDYSTEKTLLLLSEVSLFHIVDNFYTAKEQYKESIPIKINIDDRYGGFDLIMNEEGGVVSIMETYKNTNFEIKRNEFIIMISKFNNSAISEMKLKLPKLFNNINFQKLLLKWKNNPAKY